MSTTSFVRAVRRYWWLVAAGAVAAVAVSALLVDSVSPGIPPKLKARHRPTYTASALVLVNSGVSPYLRTDVTNVVTRAPKTRATRSTPATTTSGSRRRGGAKIVAPRVTRLQQVPQAPTVSLRAPETHTLVQAANLFPLLISSDQVASVRNSMFGPMKGTVTAKALYSFVTPSRFKQSAFPIIQISGTAKRAEAARRLAQDTTLAFRHWLAASQNASRIPNSQRILVQEIQSPKDVSVSGGTKISLPLALGLAVLAAFVALALLLDARDQAILSAPASDEREATSPAVA